MTDDRTQSGADREPPQGDVLGSDDYQEQGEAILMETDIRDEEPEATEEEVLQHRTPEVIEERLDEDPE
ncbi:hypothetical protein O7635_09010 [Asanoa sp. WMMD1127]|uniref:hypothetical protein n=1 Tax=Asanoa sp. WMMD1127 TaxID=3016107 RepID=UPI002418034A|nr:hypothetical protein [Asanoa sp. WMMD1127]MDG4821992.1 hypothetical protein [Asanoa sp. WMMD1127]